MRHSPKKADDLLAAVFICMVIASFIVGFVILLGGCTTQVAPNLKLPEPKPCPTAEYPPVPQNAYLEIKGDKILSDAGGEQLLRSYVSCRDVLKPK